MNHYFIYNAIILLNSNWSQCSCSTVLEGCSVSLKSTLTAAAAARWHQLWAQSQTCTAALPGAIPAPSVAGYSGATTSSFHCFPLHWACQLVQSQTHLTGLFVTSSSACSSAAAFLSGSMFAICLCTLLFSKTQFLGVLETPHINYSICVHG